ncbi:MAG: 3-oxoacyl-[acyl-carrier-protein] reductase [Vulcanimicrobiaceae bacterium]
MARLSGRVAIVTGAESGIGAATARALAADGCAVAINYLSDREAAESVRDAVLAAGARATLVAGDVGSDVDVARIFAACASDLGIPSILVNNAGTNGTGVHVADMTVDQWDATIRVNLRGPFLCARAFVRERRGRPGPAAIVNVSSIHEDIAVRGFADYDASKAALLALTRTLALEVAALGMTVNSVAPGMILTAMNAAAANDPAALEEKTAHVPLRRAGKAEEIAALVVYLCGADAAYVTGESIRIDGGLSLETGQGA